MVSERENRDDHQRVTIRRAHQEAKTLECPVCSSTDTGAVPRRERPDYWFSIKTPRECAACGTVFIPQAGAFLRTATIVIGSLLAVSALSLYLIPGIMDLISQGWGFRSLLNAVLGGVTMFFGAYVVFTGSNAEPRVFGIRDAGGEDRGPE